MTSERILNKYYNQGGYNHPRLIGYMMKMIRELRPLTETEWQMYYLSNIHDEEYLAELANSMCNSIPIDFSVSYDECKSYIYEVMFHRTFQGYNKEKQALSILRNTISSSIKESPEDWDTKYFIDFYTRTRSNQLLGIQLKPETFYTGKYYYDVDIEGKLAAFRHKYQALTYVLRYKHSSNTQTISFVNGDLLSEIKERIEK